MRGRAGRKGKDEIGESYLCCEKADLEEVAQLLVADLPMVESSLTPEKCGIKRYTSALCLGDMLTLLGLYWKS